MRGKRVSRSTALRDSMNLERVRYLKREGHPRCRSTPSMEMLVDSGMSRSRDESTQLAVSSLRTHIVQYPDAPGDFRDGQH